MNPPIKSLTSPLLFTLVVAGSFCALSCLAFGRADALRPHPVVIRTGEPDMAQESVSEPVKLWKKLALNKGDLVEIKLAGTPVTLMNGQPIVTEVTA